MTADAPARAGRSQAALARQGPAEASPASGEHRQAQVPAKVGTATATERLQRLLALVPYVVSRNVVGMEETAAAFGITERELVDDLNLLWCVELRSPDPYCPIDLSYEGGEIVVSEAEAIDRPLRLGVDEACALLIALRMLAELPSIGDGIGAQPDDRQAGAGGRRRPPGRARRSPSRWTTSPPSRPPPRSPTRSTVASGCTSPTTCPAVTRRPSGTWTRCGCWWSRAAATWKAGAAGRRTSGCSGWTASWRIEVLDVASEVPASAEHVDVDHGLFRPSPQDVQVEFELAAAGRWVAEYYPCEQVEELADGRLRMRLRTPDTQWVRRLALRLGEDGRVVSPPELAEQVIADATAALSHYA